MALYNYSRYTISQTWGRAFQSSSTMAGGTSIAYSSYSISAAGVFSVSSTQTEINYGGYGVNYNVTGNTLIEYSVSGGPIQEALYSPIRINGIGSFVGNAVAENGTYPVNGESGGYWYVRGTAYIPTNNFPTLTLSTANNLILNENDTFVINGSMLDTDNGNVVNVKYQINNEISQVVMSATSDGTTQMPFSKTLTFKSGKLYDGLITIAASLSEGVSHALKVWVEDDKGGKSTEVIRNFTVIPVIKNTRNVTLSVNKNNDVFVIFEKYYNSNDIDIAMLMNPHNTEEWVETDIISKANKETSPSALFDPSVNFNIPLLVYKDDTRVGFYGSWINNNKPSPPTLSEVSKDDKKPIERVILVASNSTDLEKDNLTYFFEFYDGKKWVEFARNQLANEKVNHYIPYIVKGSTNSKYRVRAFDGELYSDYTESNEFSVIASLNEDYIVNDTIVVDKPYNTNGVGGRKLVKLSNGWLVAASSGEPELINFKISKNNGKTWVDSQPIGYHGGILIDWAMIAKGTTIYVVYSIDVAGGGSLHYTKLDFSNEEGFLPGRIVSDPVVKMGNTSLTLSNDGKELHVAWSCKNTTYPNSFNIQYRKATFNLNGTLNWGSLEQATSSNIANFGVNYPSLITINSNPIIFTEIVQSTNDLGINMTTKVGNVWQTTRIFSDVDKTNIQSSPSAVYVPKSVNGLANGRIWLTWSGKSSTNLDVSHVYVMYSDDKGITWSSVQNLTK